MIDEAVKNIENFQNAKPEESRYVYDVITEKQSMKRAAERLSTPELIAEELTDLPRKTDFSGEDVDTAMLILNQKLQEARESGDLTEARKWMKLIQEKGTSAGQTVQSFAKYTHTPTGTVAKAEQLIREANKDSFVVMAEFQRKLDDILAGFDPAMRESVDQAEREIREAVKEAGKKVELDDAFADDLVKMLRSDTLDNRNAEAAMKLALDIPELSDDELFTVLDIMEKAQELPLYSRGRQEIEDQAYAIIAGKFNSSAMEKWDAWRYMAMLGSPTTHIRNVAGNVAMGAVTNVKNDVAALIESTVDKADRALGGNGISRTTAVLNPLSEADSALKQAARDDFDNVYSLIMGTGKRNVSQGILDNKTIYNNKVLETMRTFVGGALEKEDEFALRSAYENSLARWLKANDVGAEALKAPTEEVAALLDQGREWAIRQAKEATFRDYSSVASWLNDLSHRGTAAHVLTEGILPFKKTPMNIVKRGLEYSPAGLAKGLLSDLPKAIKNGKTASEAIESIAKGLTGTGILGVGYLMAKQGILTGAGSENTKDCLLYTSRCV